MSLPRPIDYNARVYHTIFSALVASALFLGMLACHSIGRRIGERRLAEDPDGARTGLSAIVGAIFALVGLLIAFTFSGAAARFDMRRSLIVDEANAIGTAWLRIDMLSASAQPSLRDLFRQYLDARLETYRNLDDLDVARASLGKSVDLQDQIWESALTASREAEMSQAPMLLLPALNQMFDIANTRVMTTQRHPPMIIFGLLFALALAAALFAGYDMAGGRKPSLLHRVGLALTLSLSVYVILDLEYPRIGLIRLDAADQVLIDLRASMD